MEKYKLNDLIELKKGKKPNRFCLSTNQNAMSYVDIKAFEKGFVEKFTDDEKCVKCENGDLLIVCDGSRSGLVGRAIPGYVGSTLAIIGIDERLECDYLFYFLQSKYRTLNKSVKGTGTPHLNPTLLKSFEISVPTIEEQKRIVARIEKLFSNLDSAVETLQKTKQQLEVYRQAVLREAFEKTKGYNKNTINNICSNIVDCPHSTPKWVSQGELCLRTTNFKRGYLDLSEKNYVSKDTFNSRNTRLVPMPGDVLYSREGAILGIACIIPEQTYVCLGQRMMLLRTNSLMNNRFLMYYLNSPIITDYVQTITGGSASPHVNVKDIKNISIPVPDIKTQKEIVLFIEQKFSICDKLSSYIEVSLQQAEAMRQSILKQAFEGGI